MLGTESTNEGRYVGTGYLYLWIAGTGTVQVPRIFLLGQICITPFRARYRYRPKPKVPGEYRDLQANYGVFVLN